MYEVADQLCALDLACEKREVQVVGQVRVAVVGRRCACSTGRAVVAIRFTDAEQLFFQMRDGAGLTPSSASRLKM